MSHLQAHDDRVAWLEAVDQTDYEDDGNTRKPTAPPPDAIAAAALALCDHFGWYDDPVLTPVTAVEIAEVSAAALAAHTGS